MNRRQGILFVTFFVMVGMIAGIAWLRRPGRAVAPGEEDRPVAVVEGSITLQFPGADGRLHPESRALDTAGDEHALAERVVEALLAGPQDEALFAPLPPSTAIGHLFLAENGTLFLDLISEEHPVPPVAGSQRELLAAYSLINSLCANVPTVRNVALLWNGEQRTTFAGNLDTTGPLPPNPRLTSAGG